MHHQPTQPGHAGQPHPHAPTARPGAAPAPVTRVDTATILGVTAHPVRIEAAACGGLPSVTTIGLGDTTARPMRDRLYAAITNTGHPWPQGRVTVQALPSELPKPPGGLDLPTALALLAASGAIPPASLAGIWVVGGLGLDGTLRGVQGTLPVAVAAHAAGARTLVIPTGNLSEAALAPRGLPVVGARTLAEVVAWLLGTASLEIPTRPHPATPPNPSPDLADIPAYYARARRGLEVAAAGGHHLLLVGPPGSPRKALARRLPGLLPDPTPEQALEIACVRSTVGLLTSGTPPATSRPFCAPHHSVSQPGFAGGDSSSPRPGFLTLAHHGVLYLDELGDYPRNLLACLRQPLEQGAVQVTHRGLTLRLPARILLAAATSPVPGQPGALPALRRLEEALPGLPRGRVEVAVGVQPLPAGALATATQPGEPTAAVRERVAAARARQHTRDGRLNADLPPTAVAGACQPTPEAWQLAAEVFGRHPQVTTGDFHAAMRVARTIADLAACERVTADHLAEALSFLPATSTPEVTPDHSRQQDHQ